MAHRGLNVRFSIKLRPFFIDFTPYWITKHDKALLLGSLVAGYTKFVGMYGEGYKFMLAPPQNTQEGRRFKCIDWHRVTKPTIRQASNG